MFRRRALSFEIVRFLLFTFPSMFEAKLVDTFGLVMSTPWQMVPRTLMALMDKKWFSGKPCALASARTPTRAGPPRRPLPDG